MWTSRFSAEQIIRLLNAAEADGRVADLCREHGISQAAPNRRKSKYGRMDVSDARKLHEVEDENRRQPPRPSPGDQAAA